AATGKETEIARSAWWGGPAYDFSPDSKWLVYTEVDRITYFNTLMLYEIATGKRVRIGDGMADDGSPAFSTDGQWLGFASRRNVQPRGAAFLNQLFTDNAGKAFLLALKKDTRSPFLPDDDEETPPSEKKDDDKSSPTPDTQHPTPTPIDSDGLYDRL